MRGPLGGFDIWRLELARGGQPPQGAAQSEAAQLRGLLLSVGSASIDDVKEGVARLLSSSQRLGGSFFEELCAEGDQGAFWACLLALECGPGAALASLATRVLLALAQGRYPELGEPAWDALSMAAKPSFDGDGWVVRSALLSGIKSGSLEFCSWLHGREPGLLQGPLERNSGCTALMAAAMLDEPESALAWAAAKGASWRERDAFGSDALERSIGCGNLAAAKWLLDWMGRERLSEPGALDALRAACRGGLPALLPRLEAMGLALAERSALEALDHGGSAPAASRPRGGRGPIL